MIPCYVDTLFFNTNVRSVIWPDAYGYFPQRNTYQPITNGSMWAFACAFRLLTSVWALTGQRLNAEVGIRLKNSAIPCSYCASSIAPLYLGM